MKALTITEPYASLIRDGVKHIETRSWKTRYRGPILVHASGKAIPRAYRENTDLMELVADTHPGCILCKARLVDCIEMTDDWIATLSETERICGFYSPGRYGWVLEDIEPVEPVPVKGKLGLWECEVDT